MKQETEGRKLPKGFWRIIVAAILIGNAGLLILLWLGAPSWLAVSAPIAVVGAAGIILEYRQRHARKGED